jgi:hypothetical protein
VNTACITRLTVDYYYLNPCLLNKKWTVPRLSWFVTGLFPLRPGFDSKPVDVGFVVAEVAPAQVFLR